MAKVSILLTTYDRAVFLPLAINSVLSQNFKDWELIIINDGSSDNTEEIVKKYLITNTSIKYFRNEKNLGLMKSRNLGLSFCSGEYITIIDSDDIWLDKNKLEKQVSYMDKNLNCVLYGGMGKVIDAEGKETGEIKYAESDKNIRNKILISNQFIHSAVIYRKKVAMEVGGYKINAGEDYDLFLRMGQKGELANNHDFFVKYRRHPSGLTWKNRYFESKNHLQIIKKYKNFYPNYYLALIKAYLRIIFSKYNLI